MNSCMALSQGAINSREVARSKGGDWASKWAGPTGLGPFRPSPWPSLPDVASQVF
jgi:hypothetical protein